jgi:hypothetical protein
MRGTKPHKWVSAREKARIVQESLTSMASFQARSATMDENSDIGLTWGDAGSVSSVIETAHPYGGTTYWASVDSNIISIDSGVYMLELSWVVGADTAGATYKWAITDTSFTWLEGSTEDTYFTFGPAATDGGVLKAMVIMEFKSPQSIYLHVACQTATASQISGPHSSLHITKIE